LLRHAKPWEAGHAGACRGVRDCNGCREQRCGAAARLAAAAGIAWPSRRHARPALRHERRRRLLEHPAPRRERPDERRGPGRLLRRLPAAQDELPERAAAEALVRRAEDVRRTRLRRAGPQAGRHPEVLQGRDLRREGERPRADLLAARQQRRDDRARQRLRRPSHLRQDARGDDVRARLRGRRGPAVHDGRAPERRPRAALGLRRRRPGEPRPGPHPVGARALPRGGLPASVRPRRRGLWGGRDPAAGGRDELRRGHRPLHRRGAHQPAEDAGRVRGHREGGRPAGLEGHGRDRHGQPHRRDLRQGRRPRARLSAAAAVRPEALRPPGRQGGLE
jgi:hypothetical protein